MRFLLRLSVWIFIALLFIPLDRNGRVTHVDSVSPVQALHAAQEALGDISMMCERRPDVCNAGRAAIRAAGERAREGARMAYEMLNARFGPDTSIMTGSISSSR